MVEKPSKHSNQRIAKLIARSGLCSRREAEKLIFKGMVKLDGKLILNPATTVNNNNRIQVHGKPLPELSQTRLWRYHKPTGLITTHSDPKGRPTVFDNLPKKIPRVLSVGRLDLNSEGLMLLTNDGGLARKLELPKTGWQRTYKVRVHGRVDLDEMASLQNGLTVGGTTFGPIKATLDRQKGSNSWLTISISEGKNREIRKIMAYFNLEVTRLIRLSFGPFQLGNLEKGGLDEVGEKILRKQLNLNWDRQNNDASHSGKI